MALQATHCRYCDKPMGMSHSPVGDCGARDSDHPNRGSPYVPKDHKDDDDKKDDKK
jgi:hypothetical protein